ncbi:hypothetical protein GSI_11488 [Ganoderma sinense ZZ0214-1]|uniref:Uncharacterized protein n=1 Tax=Ganoderma sinense ZZ0214-1 TaxID=1077348 RepID=A0A2G8RWP6_9APHY|nr:hypothetical protein GSI_11488 [Ganoderma sinense ZZ0214-1]
MRVCRRWYDVASRHFFAIIPVAHRHCNRFLKFVRIHPELASYITELRFFDKSRGDSGKLLGMQQGPFDIQLLASALPILPNLRIICLVGYGGLVSDQSAPSGLQKRNQSTPVSLLRLSFEHCIGVMSMFPKLLPLFAVNTFVINSMHLATFHHVPTPVVPFEVRNLVIGQGARYSEDQYAAFERILVPGGLRGLGTDGWAKQDIPILERFLRSSTGRDLLSISIGAVLGENLPPPHSAVPVINGPTVCDMLGAALAHCPRLQCFRLGFVHHDYDPSDPLIQPDPFSPIVANLPATLHIWLDTPGLWCCTSTSIGLETVDRTLAPASPSTSGHAGSRFPNLQMVELHVHQNLVWPRMRNRTCAHPHEEREPMPLLRLHAAGLLRYRVGEVELDQPHADIYWPLDM